MDTQSKMDKIRVDNLKQLVNDHEGMNALGRKLGLTRGTYISGLVMTNPRRRFTEQTARKWEEKLGLPAGWFDRPQGPAAATTQAPAADRALLTRTVVLVLGELRAAKVNLADEQIGELVSLQYTDALNAGGTPDPSRLRTLINIFKR